MDANAARNNVNFCLTRLPSAFPTGEEAVKEIEAMNKFIADYLKLKTSGVPPAEAEKALQNPSAVLACIKIKLTAQGVTTEHTIIVALPPTGEVKSRVLSHDNVLRQGGSVDRASFARALLRGPPRTVLGKDAATRAFACENRGYKTEVTEMRVYTL